MKVVNHQPLFSTDLAYFKSVQMIEGKTLFDRYKSLEQVLVNNVDERYRDFISYPVRIGVRTIEFHGVNGTEIPEVLSEIDAESKSRYLGILNDTRRYYSDLVSSLRLSGEKNAADYLEMATKYVDERFVYCYDNKVVLGAWGMAARENVYEPIDVIRKGLIQKKKRVKPVPEVVPVPTPPSNNEEEPPVIEEPPVEPPIVVVESPDYTVFFDAGEHGKITTGQTIVKKAGDKLAPADIPAVKPSRRYRLIGWDINPDGYLVDSNVTFRAQYEKKKCWLARFWAWLKSLFVGRGCLKWLLWLLLALLLLLLLFFLIKGCVGHNNRGTLSGGGEVVVPAVPPTDETGGGALGDNDGTWRESDPNVGDEGGIYDPENPYNPVPTPDSLRNVLPPQEGVLPPLGDNPIIVPGDPDMPGSPSVIGNVLNILMENNDRSIVDLARDFKAKYPDDCYQVIYYDDVVKRMQIKVPDDQRLQLKQLLPNQFYPDYQLFVFDEALFESDYIPSDSAFSSSDYTWYLSAIKAFEAWDITKGSENIIVAVVDNGFSTNHQEIRSKIVQPYNVWSHNTNLFAAEVDHGTHVAGTAVACSDNGTGLCGIAPGCRLMPVQVADGNGFMTTTSIVDGVLFALYQGADVINISLGCDLASIVGVPEDVQRDLISNHFKEEERLWREIMGIAANHSATVVVAAGNDSVLAGIDALHRPDLFITVSATDKNNSGLVKTDFSNYGEYSTISAPGEQIYSSWKDNEYLALDGTSMAAPIVSGAVALMKSLNARLTSKDIINILQATGLATEGNVGKLIQLDKALKMVARGESPSVSPAPSTGDVQVLLSWNNYNDLDLVCTDPYGNMVYFQNPTVPSGGHLEIDMNREYPDSKTPIENIYWPTGGAPAGEYHVYVKYYKNHTGQPLSTHYSVKVKYGNNVETYSGTLSVESDYISVCSFVLGGGTPSGSNPGGPYPGGSGSGGESGGAPVYTSPADGTPADNYDSRRAALERERARLQRELNRVEDELRRLSNMR